MALLRCRRANTLRWGSSFSKSSNLKMYSWAEMELLTSQRNSSEIPLRATRLVCSTLLTSRRTNRRWVLNKKLSHPSTAHSTIIASCKEGRRPNFKRRGRGLLFLQTGLLKTTNQALAWSHSLLGTSKRKSWGTWWLGRTKMDTQPGWKKTQRRS